MNTSSVVVDLDLQIADTGELVVNMELLNQLNHAIKDWTLRFDLPKEISAGEETRILGRAGSHLYLQADDNTIWPQGEHRRLQFTGDPAIIRRLTDLPMGLFVHSKGNYIPAVLGDHNLVQLKGGDAIPDCGEAAQAYTEVDSTPKVGTGPIIPMPLLRCEHPGEFHCEEVLHYRSLPAAADALNWLATALPVGLTLACVSGDSARLRFVEDELLADEAYRLQVDQNHIVIYASASAGFFYAVASLVQLLKTDSRGGITLPCQEIEDQPRFDYRGMMLDCARQFHDKSTILKLLDHMAAYKFNRFHWHLTDDEGWRIEIRAFPELTQTGAWRGAEETLEPQFGSGARRSGGYYTRQDIREVVEYAQRRQILVIPEIDIPGHSRAAIKSLPGLLVEPEDQSQYCSVQLYSDNVLNPALAGTYQFLHAVIDEVCELFPGPYVHIGADEVPEGVWHRSPACLALMAQHGYADALDLQGHLLRNVQDYLELRGKRLIGWEEAAHGDKLDHSAIICAWSSTASAATTAATGYQVIACPAPYAYLDMAWDNSIDEPGFHWAGTADLASCYAYEPYGDGFPADQRDHILGVQALLWSELITSQERLEYMLFPRLFAMAEIGWTPTERRDWENFQRRVDCHLTALDSRGINHRPTEKVTS